jgi:hypothetical protein
VYATHLRSFLTKDPLGNVDSQGLWNYVAADPINFRDPWGLAAASGEPVCGMNEAGGGCSSGTTPKSREVDLDRLNPLKGVDMDYVATLVGSAVGDAVKALSPLAADAIKAVAGFAVGVADLAVGVAEAAFASNPAVSTIKAAAPVATQAVVFGAEVSQVGFGAALEARANAAAGEVRALPSTVRDAGARAVEAVRTVPERAAVLARDPFALGRMVPTVATIVPSAGLALSKVGSGVSRLVRGISSTKGAPAAGGGGGANIVYRGLAAGENPAAGLIARAPDAANSVASHVAGARASQWISTTRSLEVATSRFGQNGVVAIDLSRVGSPIVDLTRGIPGIGPNTMLSRWAINAQEVLIQGRIPAEAIVPLP